MLTLLVVLVLVIGVNTLFWAGAGLVRVIGAALAPRELAPVPPHRVLVRQVAVLVAAHNEEAVIEATIRSAARLVPVEHVFVASDGSSDRTSDIARAHGAEVLDVTPNRGKAGALAAAIEHFDLGRRFEVVMLLDADTQLDEGYLRTGLPLFDDPEVVAVAGCARTLFDPPSPSRVGRLLVAYRERLYIAVQYLQKFGQAARGLNVVTIVPGFASMYRARILDQIDIAAPGLAIEDYNMTFEVHRKRLGRIAFHPLAAVARTQDPDTLRDYAKQVRRWSLGFWQTVRRHGPHLGRFWGALVVFIVELVSSTVFVLLLLPVVMVSAASAVLADVGGQLGQVAAWIAGVLPLWAVLVGALLPDLALTLLAAVVTRRPGYLLMAPAFPLVRVLDAAENLRALWQAFVHTSAGTWRSPARRSAAPASDAA